MGKQSNRKKINLNRQRSIDAAGALWDLAANKRIPNAIRILFEMIGLPDVVALLLRKNNGDTTVDADAVKKIAGAIERDQNLRR